MQLREKKDDVLIRYFNSIKDLIKIILEKMGERRCGRGMMMMMMMEMAFGGGMGLNGVRGGVDGVEPSVWLAA